MNHKIETDAHGRAIMVSVCGLLLSFGMRSVAGASTASVRALMLNNPAHYATAHFRLTLSSGTGVALAMTGRAEQYNFLPTDQFPTRAGNHYNQLGDITFALREKVGGAWHFYSSANHRVAVAAMNVPGTLAAENISATFGATCPLTILREWRATRHGNLALEFVIRNRTHQTVRIGALGAPMVFNNVFSNQSSRQIYGSCCFSNPYIGGDAGYIQVTRLNHKPPVMLVLPEKGTSFEAYRPLLRDPTPRGTTFEGFYEWMTNSLAYCQTQWKHAQEWNRGTAITLAPGQSITRGWKFVLTGGVRAINATLMHQRHPVAIGVPGYVLPTDQQGKLFIHGPDAIRSMSVWPRGAMRVLPAMRDSADGWQSYTLYGIQLGRCRLTIHYANGTTQFIHYFVTLPERQTVRNFGRFEARHQWYTNVNDPFHRTDAFMPFNDWTGKIILDHWPSIWMCGLSDEMGAGPNEAMAEKNMGYPNPAQVAMLEKYVDHALWGNLQRKDYGVRRDQFWYSKRIWKKFHYTIGGNGYKEDKASAQAVDRSFNYAHQADIYWCLYRIARYHPGLVTARTWNWYLSQAYRTAMAMKNFCGNEPQQGQIDGEVYLHILNDLKREGWTRQAQVLENYERGRAAYWSAERYPYESEMSWDSVVQQEIYSVCRYFGYKAKAAQVLRIIVSFDPTMPNWGYNGAGYRYFDEQVNGTQWPWTARLLHQYGAGISAVPLLQAYRDHPSDLTLLRIGYGGNMGALTDIQPNGFGSQCFDADPRIMQFDPYCGDYGIEFWGFAFTDAAYLVKSPTFGWLGFGCNVRAQHRTVHVAMRTAFNRQLYVAPFKLFIKLFSGHIISANINTKTGLISLALAPARPYAPNAYIRLKKYAAGISIRWLSGGQEKRGLWKVPLGNMPVKVQFQVDMAR